MNRHIAQMITLRVFTLMVVLSAALPAKGQDAKEASPIAPIERYLMDRNTEIALARTAAPESVSRDAEILVLGRQGYEMAIQGKNGFVCIVERAWTSAFDDPAFGSPKLVAPICFNAPAVRSHLPIVFKKTELALTRPSKAEMIDSIKAAFDKQELPSPEPGSMAYMMSKQAYFGKQYGHFHPHLMFYLAPTDGGVWGAGMARTPVKAFRDAEDRRTIFIVLVGTWSDGTSEASEAH